MEIGYLARYGHQPLSEIMELTTSERRALLDAVEVWVKKENPIS